MTSHSLFRAQKGRIPGSSPSTHSSVTPTPLRSSCSVVETPTPIIEPPGAPPPSETIADIDRLREKPPLTAQCVFEINWNEIWWDRKRITNPYYRTPHKRTL